MSALKKLGMEESEKFGREEKAMIVNWLWLINIDRCG